jgi:hypothetical protein
MPRRFKDRLLRAPAWCPPIRPLEIADELGCYRIRLPQGRFALVDYEDRDLVAPFNWLYAKIGYAFHHVNGYLHSYLMNTPKGMLTDHINHDTLDNRRCNLRVVGKSENELNKKPRKGKPFKGVSWCNARKMWFSSFMRSYAGCSRSILESAKMYNDAAIAHGGIVYLNQIPSNPSIEEVGDLEMRQRAEMRK